MSYVDEMALQFGPSDDTPVDDQAAVIEAVLDGTGRVAVDAAAGTGKTTTMLTTVAETVIRESAADTDPFQHLLLTTFTTDAASELKTRLKAVLRDHVDAGGDLRDDVLRHAETDSQIRTIDSLFHEFLREIAMEVGLPSEFELEDGEGIQDVRDESFAAARRDNREALDRLETAYPDESWRAFPPPTVREMVEQTQQKCREFCVTPAEAHDSLCENLTAGHGGHTPPTTFADVQNLLETVVFDGASLDVTVDDPERHDEIERQFTAHVQSTYERSRQLVDDFAAVLETYAERYDALTRERGTLTYMDTTHLLRTFVESNPDHPFVESLRTRFDYVFVDEFQDTSIAQARVLKELIDGEDTRLLVIGDVKQSIYQWRSADPDLFGDTISAVADAGDAGAEIPYFEVDNVVYRPLTSNFRSHPELVAAANHLFGSLFSDPGRGDIGHVDVSYVDVDARSGRKYWDDNGAHLHVLDLDIGDDGYPNRDDTWTPVEAQRVAATIDSIVDPDVESDVTVFENADDQTGQVRTRQAKPGDVTLLFRTKTHMHRYAEALRDRGIDAAPKVSDDLFAQPEVSFLVDVLYWFSNPHEEGALLRILRSPLVACSDATLRYLASEEYFLASLLDDGSWPAELPDDDHERIACLVKLRDDLRWDREGSKTNLVNRILRHSAFDAIVLADEDGLRRYGNLWLLTELVDGWEEEELLPYREFVDRLTTFRERAAEASGEPDYEVANVADPDDESTVTLTTVHAAKGREFPIVFLCDLLKQSSFPRTQHQRLVSTRRHGFALRPKPGDEPFPDGVCFDTPEGEDGEGDDAWLHDDRDDGNYPDLTGPVWISDERTDDDGTFRYQSPLEEFVRPDASEFWRMFYVAATRAADHLFVGLTSMDDWVEDWTRWTTWATTLNEHLEPDDGWGPHRGGTVDLEMEGTSLPIGVNDVPTSPPDSQPVIELSDFQRFLDQEPIDIPDTVSYRPLQVSPSRIHDLVECPRRYQYQHVQQVAPYSESLLAFDADGERATANSSPGGVPPNEWGTAVHEALEAQIDGQEQLARCVNALDDPLREYVLWVAEAFRRDVGHYRSALDEEAYAEFPVSTILDVEGGEVQVTGEIDLLYHDDGWHLVDYKTTKVPEDGSFKADKYARQLRTYAWALGREHDVEVASATLLYVDLAVDDGTVDVEQVAVSLPTDPSEYAGELRSALGSVNVLSPTGLIARPSDRRCDHCPYAASRGGPCEHGY